MRPCAAILFFVVSALLMGMNGSNAMGAQGLKFKLNPDLGPSETLLLKAYLAETALYPRLEDAIVARADLNEDGTDEIILQHDCPAPDAACGYTILADSNEKLIKIGEIKALTLALGQGYNAGIRTILAYKNPVNNFEYDIYVWEPDARQYIIKR